MFESMDMWEEGSTLPNRYATVKFNKSRNDNNSFLIVKELE